MGKLESMLKVQKSSQEKRGYSFEEMTKQELVEYIRRHVQYMTVELSEFLVELPGFKDWKLYPAEQKVNNAAAKEELIDVLHFMLNIFLAMGMSEEEIYAEYMHKAYINGTRLEDTAHYKLDTESVSADESE